MTTTRDWPKTITAITLFVDDLDAAKAFYLRAFGEPVANEDDDSVLFTFGSTYVNLLRTSASGDVIEPERVGRPDSGARAMYTLTVDDCDAICATLRERGVELLNGPIDRPWGVRTAAFRDPAGHVWEIAAPR